MKKIALSLVVLGGLINGFADECKHLWFSQKLQSHIYLTTDKGIDKTKLLVRYGKLENGSIVPYTEMTDSADSKENTFKSDDTEYVGCGKFERTGVMDLNDAKYHSYTETIDKKYKEMLLRNYEQINQK